MSTINSIPFRSTIFYRTDGTVAPIGTVFTISTNGLLAFSNNLSLNTLSASSITGNITTLSSITASTILTTGNNIALGQSVAFPNRYLELGTDVVDSVYLDFHSKDSTLSDYSTRIQSLGGTTTGTGALNTTASTIGLMASSGVGIGTTSPATKLHVYQSLDYTSFYNTYGTATAMPAQLVLDTISHRLYLGSYYTVGVGENAVIQSSSYYSSTDHSGTLLINPHGGNVGIGTNAPAGTLHVYGVGASASYTSYQVSIGNSSSVRNLLIGVDGVSASLQSVVNLTTTPSSAWLTLNPLGGNVGIGLTNPVVPLHVGIYGYGNITAGNWTASNFNSALSAIYNTSQNISAYFLGYASSSIGFLTYSDKRIKKDIEPATNCLDAVLQLQAVTYRKKNMIEDGNELHTGFIAQDVQEIYPSAIHKRTDTIPSIYEIRHASLVENGIQLTESIDVPLDARVVVIDFRNKKIQMIHRPDNVLIFEEQSDTIELDGDKVFIFGHEVSDKLMLNHDSLFAVGMGAIKELAQKHNALTATCAALQARMDALEARLAS